MKPQQHPPSLSITAVPRHLFIGLALITSSLLLSKESYFTDDSEMLSALFYYKFVQSERIPFVYTDVHTVSGFCHEAESRETEETYGQIVKQQAIERPAVSCYSPRIDEC